MGTVMHLILQEKISELEDKARSQQQAAEAAGEMSGGVPAGHEPDPNAAPSSTTNNQPVEL